MTWLPLRRLARRLFCVRGFCPRWRVAPPKLNTIGGRAKALHCLWHLLVLCTVWDYTMLERFNVEFNFLVTKAK